MRDLQSLFEIQVNLTFSLSLLSLSLSFHLHFHFPTEKTGRKGSKGKVGRQRKETPPLLPCLSLSLFLSNTFNSRLIRTVTQNDRWSGCGENLAMKLSLILFRLSLSFIPFHHSLSHSLSSLSPSNLLIHSLSNNGTKKWQWKEGKEEGGGEKVGNNKILMNKKQPAVKWPVMSCLSTHKSRLDLSQEERERESEWMSESEVGHERERERERKLPLDTTFSLFVIGCMLDNERGKKKVEEVKSIQREIKREAEREREREFVQGKEDADEIQEGILDPWNIVWFFGWRGREKKWEREG